KLRHAAWQTYNFTEEPRDDPRSKARMAGVNKNTPEFEAMVIMGLEPPLSLEGIKARYKELAKKHHPDLNGGSAESEELLKQINMAYTILKLSYEQFAKLPDKA